MRKTKYRIKQINNRFYPQYKDGLFDSWKNIYRFWAHIVLDGKLRIQSFYVSSDTLQGAESLINEYKAWLDLKSIYRHHLFLSCEVDNYSKSNLIFFDWDFVENGLYSVWHENLKKAYSELNKRLDHYGKD